MKLNTKNIEGYEKMTPEEKVAALEGYELDMTGWIAKATFDKTASELAAAKRDAREKMSAEEKTAAALKELQDKNAELSQQILISQHTAQYVAMGYDNTQAAAAAKALAEGDLKTVFELQTAFNASREKSIRAEAMKRMNAPTGGGTEESESANVTLAKEMGREAAASAKATATVVDAYRIK